MKTYWMACKSQKHQIYLRQTSRHLHQTVYNWFNKSSIRHAITRFIWLDIPPPPPPFTMMIVESICFLHLDTNFSNIVSPLQTMLMVLIPFLMFNQMTIFIFVRCSFHCPMSLSLNKFHKICQLRLSCHVELYKCLFVSYDTGQVDFSKKITGNLDTLVQLGIKWCFILNLRCTSSNEHDSLYYSSNLSINDVPLFKAFSFYLRILILIQLKL